MSTDTDKPIIPKGSLIMWGEWTEEQRKRGEFPRCEYGCPSACGDRAEFLDFPNHYPSSAYYCWRHAPYAADKRKAIGLSVRAADKLNMLRAQLVRPPAEPAK